MPWKPPPESKHSTKPQADTPNKPHIKPSSPWDNKPTGKNNVSNNPVEQLIKEVFGKKGGSGGGPSGLNRSHFGLIGLMALVFVFAASYFQLDPPEEAVILKFGKYNQTVGEGPHFFPPFVYKVYKENTTDTRNKILKKSMLTSDQNIVQIDLQLEYRIADLEEYVLNIKEAETVLRHASESALRHVVGGLSFADVIGPKREEIAIDMKPRIQEYLDNYGSGLQIGRVKVTEALPPKLVEDAYLDVNRAKKNRKAAINQAQEFANKVIPEAQGVRQEKIEQAKAYRSRRIAEAEGEASRFDSLYAEYKKAPKVTRDRLYLETMEKVYGNTTKILVDGEAGNNLLYLPFDKLMAGQENSQVNSQVQGSTPSQQPQTSIINSATKAAQQKTNSRLRTRGYPQ